MMKIEEMTEGEEAS